MCSARGLIFIIITNERVYAHDISLNAGAFESKECRTAADSHDSPVKNHDGIFSTKRRERSALTLVESSSSSSNIREEKSALESFRKKRESSLRNKEKFTGTEKEEEEVQRPKNGSNKTIHDVFAHSACSY